MIAEHCADPQFHDLLKRIHPQPWASGEQQGLNATDTSRAILRMACDVKSDDEVSETHPEVRALFAHLARERAQVADENG